MTTLTNVWRDFRTVHLEALIAFVKMLFSRLTRHQENFSGKHCKQIATAEIFQDNGKIPCFLNYLFLAFLGLILLEMCHSGKRVKYIIKSVSMDMCFYSTFIILKTNSDSWTHNSSRGQMSNWFDPVMSDFLAYKYRRGWALSISLSRSLISTSYWDSLTQHVGRSQSSSPHSLGCCLLGICWRR